MCDHHAKSLRNIVLGPVESARPLWYAGPDLATAVITDSPRPRIVRAWRLRPIGTQETLKQLDFRGEVKIDPRLDDIFRALIEQRKRTSDNPLDDELRNTGFKVVANSGAYGDFAETNPADIDMKRFAGGSRRSTHTRTNVGPLLKPEKQNFAADGQRKRTSGSTVSLKKRMHCSPSTNAANQ